MTPIDTTPVTMTRTYNNGIMEVSCLTDDSEGNSERITLTFKSLGSNECFEINEVSDSEVVLTITGAWEIGGVIDGLNRIFNKENK